MPEKDTDLIPVAISPSQIISAVRNMDQEQRESFLEDLLAAVSSAHLESIREEREDYKTGRTHLHTGESLKFPVTMYQDEEGWYVAECPVVPGCLSQGQTEDEALTNIQEAIQLCLDVRREQGLPLTIRSLEVEVPSGA